MVFPEEGGMMLFLCLVLVAPPARPDPTMMGTSQRWSGAFLSGYLARSQEPYCPPVSIVQRTG